MGGMSESGYGQIMEQRRSLRTHRVAWELVAGPIPDGMIVCHTCDCHACCRNDDEGVYYANGSFHPRRGHLWLGTNADNSADMIAKGRAATGEKNARALYPERTARGERSGAYTHPERLARGDRHGSRTHPEAIPRGENHHWQTHPEGRLRGERNGLAKLTADAVRDIRSRHTAGTASYSVLAAEYRVSKQVIAAVVKRKTWQHVE
jgi:hypothetical protein